VPKLKEDLLEMDLLDVQNFKEFQKSIKEAE